ncbi:hypothetical protein [Litorihabitans aurantiacus]|uniref:hypothetical protein n=1 Tax=Litorihabitans aurantiacus TaxID=1930061 RepID=UPI0024E08814|nr:hypothetical protein [Litorihabitans aurantiacus]
MAFDPWLIELPWCTHRGPSDGAGSTGASAVRSTSSTASWCGNQISTTCAPP